MTRKYGVSSTGLIAPIIREGDDIAQIVTDTVLNAIDNIEDNDVIGITESVVARAQGNYVTIDEVAKNIKEVIKESVGYEPDTIWLFNPIYSRNRFAMILKAFARATGKTIGLYMPTIDEVGNVLRNHPFTGLNYDDYYKSIILAEGKESIIVTDQSNEENLIKNDDVIVDCRLHVEKSKDNPHIVLSDFCKDKCEWGLLGSNKASEEKLKLFPSEEFSIKLCHTIAEKITDATGKEVFVMIYGDGCFKDPIGGIWEFADPVTSPGYNRSKLRESPNELKLKNLADEKYAHLNGRELSEAIREQVKRKDKNLVGQMASQGTTPRRYIDLLASLMDLTSGSGDKGTPIVYVKRYFENYGTEK